MKSQEPFGDTIGQISTVANGVIDWVLSILSGRPSIADRQRLHEEHQETLTKSRIRGDEMLARLHDCVERMAAKYERDLERCRKAKASVDKHRQELANSDLPPDEIRRMLLFMDRTMKAVEDRLETDAKRLARARRRERHAAAMLDRTNSRWERFIERERVALEKDGSVFGVLRRVWRVVAPVILYFLVTDRISGRRNTKD